MTRGHGTDLVVFSLAGHEYGFPLEDVAEIVLMVAVLPVPDSPPWLLGIADVRTQTVPVVDLRARLGIPAAAIDVTTPMIIVRREGRLMGFVVDAAHDVRRLPAGAVEPPDEVHSGGVLSGIARVDGKTIAVLDAAPLFDAGAALDVPLERFIPRREDGRESEIESRA
ncbi:MAG: chemotaxis protein CheW [Actinomycetota bacterium]|nr:chemotaxis protein CheW [Actinomycetota bacterium]